MIKITSIITFALFGFTVGAYSSESKITVKEGETIVFLGDSITALGTGSTGYCHLVMRGLESVGIHATPIFAGVSGETSHNMLVRFQSDVLDVKPDHLFIATGVNDIWGQHPDLRCGYSQPSGGTGVILEHYKIYMKQLLDRSEKAGIQVILSTITPIVEDPDFKTNRESKPYNDFLRSLAKECGVPIAELKKAMFDKISESKNPAKKGKESREVTIDGVHPNGTGYRVMAKGILKAMGFSAEELAKAENSWDNSPALLVLGGRQIRAGGRTGGWAQLLLDGLGSSDVTVKNYKTLGKKKMTISSLVELYPKALETKNISTILLIPPHDDIYNNTPLEQCRLGLKSLIQQTQAKGIPLIISTMALIDNDPDSKINAQVNAYSELIREMAKKEKVALIDINAIMRDHYKKRPGSWLTTRYPDKKEAYLEERFNHEGNLMFAQDVLRSLGYKDSQLPKLKKSWDNRETYTRKYSFKAPYTVNLSRNGREVLKEIEAHHHKPSSYRITSHGLYLLLNDDPAKNSERLTSFDKDWVKDKVELQDTPLELSFGCTPSNNHMELMNAYMEKHQVDLSELYLRAFKVGVYSFRKEDLVGRGAY